MEHAAPALFPCGQNPPSIQTAQLPHKSTSPGNPASSTTRSPAQPHRSKSSSPLSRKTRPAKCTRLHRGGGAGGGGTIIHPPSLPRVPPVPKHTSPIRRQMSHGYWRQASLNLLINTKSLNTTIKSLSKVQRTLPIVTILAAAPGGNSASPVPYPEFRVTHFGETVLRYSRRVKGAVSLPVSGGVFQSLPDHRTPRFGSRE